MSYIVLKFEAIEDGYEFCVSGLWQLLNAYFILSYFARNEDNDDYVSYPSITVSLIACQSLEFFAFKGHFLQNRRFSVIPKLVNNTAGHIDHNNGNIRPIVAPTVYRGPWPMRIIVVMLVSHLGVHRATVILALSPFVKRHRILPGYRGKVKAMRRVLVIFHAFGRIMERAN